MTADKIKWSYLAGLFDGEGSISISSYPYTLHGITNNRGLCQIQISNTSIPLMKWLVANFGGVYYSTQNGRKPNWKTRNDWKPKGAANKEKFLLGILPYLVIKREQVNLALQYLRLEAAKNVEERNRLAMECQKLNQRGISVETNTLNTESSVKIESELQGDLQSAPMVTLVA